MKVCTVPSKPAFAPVTIQITIEDEGDLALLWAMNNHSRDMLVAASVDHPQLKKKALQKYHLSPTFTPLFELINDLAISTGLRD